jgi:hypothetical protein
LIGPFVLSFGFRVQPTALDIAVVQWLWKQGELLPFNIVQITKLIEDLSQRNYWIPFIAKSDRALQIVLVV